MLILEQDEKPNGAEPWHPDFLDNLDKPVEQRAGFMVRTLSSREIERVQREKRTRHLAKTAGKSRKAAAKAEAAVGEQTADALLDLAVTGLFGWHIQKTDGSREEITTWRKLRDVLYAKTSLGLAPVDMFNALFVHVTGGAELGEKLESE